MGVAPGDDEQFGWREYLLYNRSAASASWSMPRTAGAWSSRPPARPRWPRAAARATYLGKVYQQQYAYNAETTYVAGEFYWQVERGQKTFNRDFANGSAPAVDGALGQRADLVVRQQDRQRGRRGGVQARRARRTCSSAATRCR